MDFLFQVGGRGLYSLFMGLIQGKRETTPFLASGWGLYGVRLEMYVCLLKAEGAVAAFPTV